MSEYDEIVAKIAKYLNNEFRMGNLEFCKRFIKNTLIKFPELAIVERVKPEHLEAYHPSMQEKILNGWVKEVEENDSSK